MARRAGRRRSTGFAAAVVGAAAPDRENHTNTGSRPAVALVGDGAMQMNWMAELITVKKYFHQWDDPRLVVLVLNNQDLNQVTWEQRALQGDPKSPITQDIPEVNYAAYADLIGLKGIRVETPDEIEGAWDQAFSSDRPVIVDALCDHLRRQVGLGDSRGHPEEQA